MTDGFGAAPSATLLDPDTLAGLIPPLTTQGDLNEFEAANILEARLWALGPRSLQSGFPSEAQLRELHRRMFDKTWRWAGGYRHTETNIGTDWRQIAVQVRLLCDDIACGLSTDGVDGGQVSAVFHHRLVSIHPFPNGNGRHSRLATDVVRHNRGWGPWHGHGKVERLALRVDLGDPGGKGEAGSPAVLWARGVLSRTFAGV